MAAARQGLPVRLDRAPQRGAAFALTRASRRARTRSIGSRSRARGLSLIFENPPPPLSPPSIAPAGSPDIVGRLIGQWLSERLGQQFVIDNRPGGGGNVTGP